MLRAIIVALGAGLVVVWLVGVVDGSTIWMTWLDGAIALLALGNASLITPRTSAIASLSGPALLGSGLLVVFIVGVATHATSWLTWFTFLFACGFFLVAGLGFFLKVLEPPLESRRPLAEQ